MGLLQGSLSEMKSGDLGLLKKSGRLYEWDMPRFKGIVGRAAHPSATNMTSGLDFNAATYENGAIMFEVTAEATGVAIIFVSVTLDSVSGTTTSFKLFKNDVGVLHSERHVGFSELSGNKEMTSPSTIVVPVEKGDKLSFRARGKAVFANATFGKTRLKLLII
ncbi:hypothetical protein F862_gp024 [Vibrio phage vB_VpaS_MAR10]|uniref:Uncharacterized protein n=1 Tax=Vibrio phage vB_VpaS_MAR10 TaxID=1229755 RepID=K7R6B2_9CAUD|nr:hypothetical protein F862_gp024 [Vibrio phage vB_VpaS_MAR10]AFV81256.1 hypothetical protein MAR10_024 [Vibrio phage vB_VpaS_MAR10]